MMIFDAAGNELPVAMVGVEQSIFYTQADGTVTGVSLVNGRAAHAGSAHRNGANSVVQLAEIISKVARMTDYDKEITFNVATAAGGTVLNRVPHYAVASGEARAFSPAVLNQGLNELLALEDSATVRSMNGDYLCHVDVEILGKWEPWPSNEASEKLFSVWKKSVKFIGNYEFQYGIS